MRAKPWVSWGMTFLTAASSVAADGRARDDGIPRRAEEALVRLASEMTRACEDAHHEVGRREKGKAEKKLEKQVGKFCGEGGRLEKWLAGSKLSVDESDNEVRGLTQYAANVAEQMRDARTSAYVEDAWRDVRRALGDMARITERVGGSSTPYDREEGARTSAEGRALLREIGRSADRVERLARSLVDTEREGRAVRHFRDQTEYAANKAKEISEDPERFRRAADHLINDARAVSDAIGGRTYDYEFDREWAETKKLLLRLKDLAYQRGAGRTHRL